VKKLTIVPSGWTRKLKECDPGFFVHDEELCLISEYKTNNDSEFYESFCSSGEFCCLDYDTIVQPVTTEWEDIDE